jgi:glycogen phosphorylase
MKNRSRVSHPIYYLLPTEIEGFDSLAELALDMRWFWNHATDEVWRQLDPALWGSPTTLGSSCRRSRGTKSSAC